MTTRSSVECGNDVTNELKVINLIKSVIDTLTSEKRKDSRKMPKTALANNQIANDRSDQRQ